MQTNVNQLTSAFEERLERKLNDDEVEFIKWMVNLGSSPLPSVEEFKQ